MRFWFKISVCQSSMVHGDCCVSYLIRVGNLKASTVRWTESARRLQLSGNQAAVDRVCHIALEDFALSQEDKPKRHRSAREISHETAVYRSSVPCAQDNLRWSPAPMLQMTSCSADVWSPCSDFMDMLRRLISCRIINRISRLTRW